MVRRLHWASPVWEELEGATEVSLVDEDAGALVDVTREDVEATEPISTGWAPTRESAKLTICQVSKVATDSASIQAPTNLHDIMCHCLRPVHKRVSG